MKIKNPLSLKKTLLTDKNLRSDIWVLNRYGNLAYLYNVRADRSFQYKYFRGDQRSASVSKFYVLFIISPFHAWLIRIKKNIQHWTSVLCKTIQ